MTSALPLGQHSDREAAVIGSSPEMVRVSKLLELLPSKPRTPVMILGESGVGKRHIASALHRATYPQGELVALESSRALAQLDRIVQETASRPGGGGTTLYVHELTETPSDVQTRLLQLFRDMTDGPSAVRLVASSSRDLVNAARDGFLRHELAYRFPVVLQLPPLRERVSDIPELVAHFARSIAERFGGSGVSFSSRALARLTQYDWPGNVGELYNVVERSGLFADRAVLDLEDLPQLSNRQSAIASRLPPTGICLSDLEREVLVQALRITENNQTRAAALLGLTRDQMRYRMAKFGIASRESSVPPPPLASEQSGLRARKETMNSNG